MRRLPVALAALALGACGWLPNHILDYRTAASIEPMTLPDGMVLIGEEPLYPVPDGVPAPVYESDRDEAPLPPRLEIAEPEQVADEEPAPAAADAPGATRIVMARDGNGYPIIMMHTSFTWAWEHVSRALEASSLEIADRNRDAGLFWLRVPKEFGVAGNRAQLKLSHTANGIQIAVLENEDVSLLAKEPGQKIIQHLYDRL